MGKMEIDLIHKTSHTNNPDAFKITYDNKRDKTELYKGEEKAIMNYTWEKMSINVDFFKNPQIRTGISICYSPETTAYGLLTNSYNPEIFKLANLKNSVNIFEKYNKYADKMRMFTNNNAVSIKKSNEKWTKH